VSSDWSRFYDAAGNEPRETLLDALARFDAEDPSHRFAVDLGCGTGRDTVELLRRGWSVLAVDGQPEAIERLRARRDLPAAAAEQLEMRVASFEDVALPPADLVNSSFALPFCRPEAFPSLWQRIVDALGAGGRFCGQLFGDRDGWSGEDDMTFLTRDELDALLAPFEPERLDEVEEDGKTAVGDAKHWHLFHVVARKA
jgi:SAM-dependent methyltransferase